MRLKFLILIFIIPFCSIQGQQIDCPNTNPENTYYTLELLHAIEPDDIFINLSTFKNFNQEQYIRNLQTVYCQNKEVKDSDRSSRILINLGISYYAIGKYKSSRKMYEEALEQLETSENIGLKVDANVFISVLFFDMNIIEGSLYHANIFRDLAVASDSTRWKGDAYHTLGRIEQARENYDTALDYYTKALDYYPPGSDYVSKGYTYHDIGQSHISKGEYQNALDYYLRAKYFWEEIDHKRGRAQIYQLLSGLYADLKKFVIAERYVNESIQICREISYNSLLAINLLQKAALPDYMTEETSLPFILEAKSIGQSNDLPYVKQHAAFMLSEYYSAIGDYEKAHAFYKEHASSSQEQASTILEENLQWLEKAYYESKLKEYADLEENKAKQLKTINLQRRLIILASLFLIGVSLFSFFYYRLFRKGVTLNSRLKELNSTNEKNVELLELKQEELNRANNEIIEKNKLLNGELSEKALALSHKYELLEEINKVLVDKKLPQNQRNKKIENLLLQQGNDSFWEEFETHFKNANATFYEELTRKHPALTPAELKLSGLLKMNLNTKEIAGITFRSGDSIKVARSRLRKKLGLGSDMSLPAYMNSFST